MPELEFRVEGEQSERVEQWQKENRPRAPSTGSAKSSGKVLGLSLKSTLLIVAAAVTLHAVMQRRSAVLLDSFAPNSTRKPAPTGGQAFGTTKWSPHSLKGDVYLLPVGACSFPDFTTAQPVGTIYTKELNITRRATADGFPGMIGTNQAYAIDYTGTFSLEKDAQYRFTLESDDASMLFVDNELIIDLRGCHEPRSKPEVKPLRRGSHQLRVQYLENQQGGLALVLLIQRE